MSICSLWIGFGEGWGRKVKYGAKVGIFCSKIGFRLRVDTPIIIIERYSFCVGEERIRTCMYVYGV